MIKNNDLSYISKLIKQKLSYKGPCIVGISIPLFGLIWAVLRFFHNKNIDDQINSLLFSNQKLDRVQISKLQFKNNKELIQETKKGLIIGIIVFICIWVIIIIVTVILVVTLVHSNDENSMNIAFLSSH